MMYLGDFVEDDTVCVMFNTFTSDDPSASSTITNFINTDVHIHKEDDLTQRNNAAGITVSVNFDGITGSHMIKIDTNDDTVGGFWVTGKDYFVRIEGTTVDGATINAVVAHFSIENRFMRGTDSAALASVCTEARLAELAAANLPTDVDAIKAKTDNLPADPASETNVDANETKIDAIKAVTDSMIVLDTTIASVTTPDTVFVVNAGLTGDDDMNSAVCSIYDATGGVWSGPRKVTDYDHGTLTITTDEETAFPLQVGDRVVIWNVSYTTTAAAGSITQGDIDNIANAVRIEPLTSDETIGSIGWYLKSIEDLQF